MIHEHFCTIPSRAAGATPNSPNQEHLHKLATEASATFEDAKAHGAEQYENLRDLATDQIDSLVEGAQSAASALEGKDSLGLSQYLTQLATGLGSFADQVRDKSAEDLLHKGAQLARDNPALFLAGSVAIGFGLSRFLRASAGHAATTSPYSASSSSTSADLGRATPNVASEENDYLATPDASQSTGAVADPIGEAAIHPSPDNQTRGLG
jgi:hypothetical protein